MASYILAHDLGTTGDKATIFSDDGRLLASAFTPYPTCYPESGWAEQDPGDYWRAFCESTRKIINVAKVKPCDIGVVSFSGQMMAALPVDGEGNALRNSIIWADLRSTKQAERVAERIGSDRVYELTGHRLSASYSATKIMWIREREPEIYRNASKFIHAKDFVVCKLTGNIYSDFSDATGMNLLDIESLEWSEELLEATGIEREKLPDLLESTGVAGKVTREAALESGLLEGTPVVIGGGDGPCATCGSGVVRGGESYIYLGTSTWMGLATTRPLIDPRKRTFTFSHFRRGLYMAAGTMQAGGGSLKWFRDVIGDAERYAAEKAGVDAYELLTLKAGEVPCGSRGLLFLPYLMGERSPLWDPDARGCFLGLTMVHTKSHMVRAVLEGVAYNMRSIAEAFEELGQQFKTIRFIGGGAKSRLWRAIFSDVLGKPIERLNFIDEATSVGAAIAGGVGTGIFASLEDAERFVRVEEEVQPDEKNVRLYNGYYGIFKECYARLAGVFKLLACAESKE